MYYGSTKRQHAGILVDPADGCAKCRGPVVDLRGYGFSAEAMKREGGCYLWWLEPGITASACNARGD